MFVLWDSRLRASLRLTYIKLGAMCLTKKRFGGRYPAQMIIRKIMRERARLGPEATFSWYSIGILCVLEGPLYGGSFA